LHHVKAELGTFQRIFTVDANESLQPWMLALGQEIRAKRKGVGLSQDALAKLVGLKKRNMIGRYEKGTDVPSVEIFGRIALTLGITEVNINGSQFLVRRPADRTPEVPEQFSLEFDKEYIYPEATLKITPVKLSPTEVTITIVMTAPVVSR
jgi:transcriptional regulator with XRE-family HTH domain